MSTTRTVRTQPAPVASLRPSRQRVSLIVILLITMTVAFFDRVNISILAANDSFVRDMGIKGHPVQIGLMMTLFLIAYGTANVCFSPLGDVFGPRKATCFAVTLWAASMIVGGLTGAFSVMLGSRLLLGLGEGIHHPMQSKYIKKWFPPQERGRANAVWNIGTSLAPAIAMPIFAWNIAAFGWRSNFFVCAVLSLIPLYLLWFHTADSPQQHKKVNALELHIIEDALAREAKRVETAPSDQFWDNVKVLTKNYRFWLMIMYYNSTMCVFWGMFSWLPSYLKLSRGFTWTQMGMLSSLPFIFAVLGKAAAGWLSDRVGRYAPFCLGAALIAALCIYFGAIVHNNVVAALLLSLGMGAEGSGIPPAWTLLQGLVPSKTVSVAAGSMNGIASAVAAASPLMIGFLIGHTGTYASGLFFMVGAAVVAAALMLTLVIQKY
jgi:sugar phosphate permease